MDMKEQNRNNFFKLIIVIADVAILVIRKYIKEKILGPYSFETFLNQEKHKLVHIFETSQCCQCKNGNIDGEKLISKKQLLVLYKSEEGNQISNHKRYAGKKLTQICICKYSAINKVEIGVVDITLANHIIEKCRAPDKGIHHWVKHIRDLRNEIFHLSDIKQLTDDEFSRKWTQLEGSIMGIASNIGSACASETEKSIMQTKKLIIISDYMLKYEIVCRDYWRDKIAEFERAQTKEVEEKAAALHQIMPEQFSRLNEKDCQKSMIKIDHLVTMVDQIKVLINIFGNEEHAEKFCAKEQVIEDSKKIHIPVFMEIEIPTSWDKTKVFEAIDELRLKGTPDMNIRIKAIAIDDLNVYAEIAKMVLCNACELRSEINKTMSAILSEAEIDTTEHEQFGVNLKVQDISEKEPNKEAFAEDQASVKHNFPVSVTARQQFDIKKIKNEKGNIYSCLKTSKTLVLIDFDNNQIITCNIDGTEIHQILLSNRPYFITEIESNTVAVTCSNRTILIIHIHTRHTVTNTIKTSGKCWGISYNDNNLYVVINRSKIDVMDLAGNVKGTIPLPSDDIHDITVDRDRLVCIDNTSIYCCSLDGNVMWKFKQYEIRDLRRVTMDEEKNVYVTSGIQNTVVIVSDDGKHERKIATKSDELDKPCGIYFDKKENILFVCYYRDGQAFLFDVTVRNKVL